MTKKLHRNWLFNVMLLAIAGVVVVILLSQKGMHLKQRTFAMLSGWEKDNHQEALQAFLRSCQKVQGFTVADLEFSAEQLQKACDQAKITSDAKTFFEQWFTPYQIVFNGDKDGLFTGYFEISLKGSRERTGQYQYPIYQRPNDLVTLNLQDFGETYEKLRLVGYVHDGKMKPYHTRKAIDGGVLEGQGVELAYADDPVALFFLHIQGSGRLLLEDGTYMRVGFAQKNGHRYTSIGRVLKERGLIDPENISAQTIQTWLRENQQQAVEILNQNASYIFFRELTKDGVIGGEGVPLSPERSLAVDHQLLPYGLPLWVNTTLPNKEKYRRLFIAQDTGSAIKGAIRGDIFFGFGDRAEQLAGEMQSQGEMVVLLPKLGNRE